MTFLTDSNPWFTAFVVAEWAIRIVMLIVVPFRRSPDAAKGWLLLILFEPAVGLAMYLVFGRRRLPDWRLRRAKAFGELARPVYARLAAHPNVFHPEQDANVAPAVRLAEKLGDLPILGGNDVDVLSDYDAIVDRLVADIEGARSHVHLLFYIIADDAVTDRIVGALKRAVKRGVVCRVMADALGSRGMGYDALQPRLHAAGIEACETMRLSFFRRRGARADLRNHRKIAVIDGAVAYFGSQNIVGNRANPGLVNEELAVRATGPIVRHLHALLLADRYLETDDLPPEVDLRSPWTGSAAPSGRAQVLPSGPGFNEGTAESIMIALMYGAADRIVLTAPYVVPSEAFLAAMCTAARRGVNVELIVDSKSNKPMVQLAQESCYDAMLAAGVRILRRTGSFLHAKHMSVDDDIVLIGSSNLDIRSFALNAEVSVLIRDADVAAALHQVQMRYRAGADPVTLADRARTSPLRRTMENLARLTDSVL
jgi:cardiolipin synthase A/B